MSVKEVSSNKCQGGYQEIFSHVSTELGCEMNFAVYLPAQATEEKCPVLYWLSGLTCNEQNFVQKAGAQELAAEYGFIIVCPDTSPRGLNIPGEDDSWEFGSGAGFYVDAKQDPWKKNYRMYSYITKELYDLVNGNFPTRPDKWGIFGHSMGGHGALTCFLKNPNKFKSVSAFAPICNPIECPWGKKAFAGYLGPNEDEWKEWDATELIKTYAGHETEIFIDQGDADNFYTQGQLLPENFEKAQAANDRVTCRLEMRKGYDHSYYYIQSFISDHFEHHFTHLVEREADEERVKAL